METKKVLIHKRESKLWAMEGFCTKDHMKELRKLVLEVEPPVKVRGKICRQRRNVGFYSDVSEGYRYSGQMMKSQPLSVAPLLEGLMNEVNTQLGTEFNGILVNHYKNGEKYISAHSDDESELDRKNGMVAALSFGATRKFRIRDKKSGKKVLDYLHKPLSLLVMEGKFQKDFTHEIPKEKRIRSDRISLTFRQHVHNTHTNTSSVQKKKIK